MEQEEDSLWVKVKDDLVANIIVEIENVNLYLFLKEYILKGEIKNILFLLFLKLKKCVKRCKIINRTIII